jgi:pheromone shutdown protein TraB
MVVPPVQAAQVTSADRVNALLVEQRDALKARFTNIRATIDSIIPVQSQQRSALEAQRDGLESQKTDLEEELAGLKQKERALNKSFQDAVYYKAPPTSASITTLQDFALAIFAVGWFLLGGVIVAISKFQVGGSWRSALLALALYTIITMVVYSIFNIYL